MSENLPHTDRTWVASSSDGAVVEIARHGGHVCRWRTADGAEPLYLSPLARESDAPIRGGIPIVFPQFADSGSLPKHGFARTAPWMFVEQATLPDGAARLGLALEDTDSTRALWNHRFRLDLGITVAGAALEMELLVRNPGHEPFEFTSALHTYLAACVPDAHLAGLQGLRFVDEHGNVSADANSLLVDRHIQRFYFGATRPVLLVSGNRHVSIHHRGFTDIVVWNPWSTAPEVFPDLPSDGYRRFVCVEPAVIEHAVQLPPGATWRGVQRLVVER